MERASIARRVALKTAGAIVLMVPLLAWSHPHMWIDAKAQFVFDAQGRLTAIKQNWLFDDMFSPYAMQGVNKGKDGKYPAPALKAMADDWVQALGEPISHYFTTVTVDGKRQTYGEPRDAAVRWDTPLKRLALSFTLPLAKPLDLTGRAARIDIYDPTYFVAYSFEAKDAVVLERAPAQCESRYVKPKELDFETMQQLAAIPPDPDPSALPEELFAITRGLTHSITLRCG